MTNSRVWNEYDHAAMELARKGLRGDIGDPLPNLMSADSVNLINDDPEAFHERVRLSAYALAMEECPVCRRVERVCICDEDSARSRS
jgi:hypothetical protein